jgi:O-antigen/teichoic acid export membrane protein
MTTAPHLEPEVSVRRRSQVARNIIANFAGRAWTSLLILAFIPLYVRLMGVETYGLVGIFVSVSALASVLDLGLSSTLSRELARLSASPGAESTSEARDLVRTFEIVFWCAGAAIGAVLVGASPLLARYWITPGAIPEITVARAFAAMGLLIAVQWPTALYEGGMMGLQRQVPLNAVKAIGGLVQHGGAVLALWLISPSVLIYLGWQIAAGASQTIVLRLLLWRSLGSGAGAGSFKPALLTRHGRFAAGISAVSILSIVLTQADKLVLSKLLPLVTFGYYVLATNVASILVHVTVPFFAALFPRFTQVLAGRAEGVDASALYHASCQSVAAFVVPIAALLAFFPSEILGLWLRDPQVVVAVAPLARLLVVGQALNSLMVIPAVAQMAFGWTRLIIVANALATAFLVPLMILGVVRFGEIGAPVAWIVLNASYVAFMIPAMHRRLLPGEMWRWYGEDVGLPTLVAVPTVALSRIAMPHLSSPLVSLGWIALTGGVAFAACALAMPFTREVVVRWLNRFR